jgi:hypothetical protein
MAVKGLVARDIKAFCASGEKNKSGAAFLWLCLIWKDQGLAFRSFGEIAVEAFTIGV